MKTIPVSIILTGLLTPAIANAQDPDPSPRRPGPDGKERPRMFLEAWKKADADGNGSISRVEFDSMPRIQNIPEDKRDAIFARLDKNDDGQLSRDELKRPENQPPGPRPEHKPRLAELDTDKSGGISLDEFKAGPMAQKLPPERVENIFKRLDRDGDGEITPKDRPEPPPRGPDGKRRGDGGDKPPHNPPDPRRIFSMLDTDKDQSLTFEEFSQHPGVKNLDEDAQEDRFEAHDRNKDGKLTIEEMRPPQRDAPPPAE